MSTLAIAHASSFFWQFITANVSPEIGEGVSSRIGVNFRTQLNLRIPHFSRRIPYNIPSITTLVVIAFFLSLTVPARTQTACLEPGAPANWCLDEVPITSGISVTGQTPLILIHGWNPGLFPTAPTPEVWNSFIAYYESDAGAPLRDTYKLYRFSYVSNIVSLTDLGQALRDGITFASADYPQKFGSSNIAIVAHSMGGLIARSFMGLPLQGAIPGQKGGDRVLKLITLGTPHHGTPVANGPVRDITAGLGWAISLTGADAALRSLYSQVNRRDLWWDNYDGLWNSALSSVFCLFWCADAQNGELISLNTDYTYDGKIIAYAGSIAPNDEKRACDSAGVLGIFNAAACQYESASTVLGGVFNLANDGIVPVDSAQFKGHTLFQSPSLSYFSTYNHTELICGQNNADCKNISTDTKVFDRIRRDLAVSPPAVTADLTPQAITLSSYTLSPGANFTVNWSLANLGTAQANSSSTTVIRISPSPTKATGTDLQFIDTPAVGALSAVPQATTTPLTAPTTPGKYYVWVIADNYGAVTNQSDTSNDLQPSAAFTVTGPSADLIPLNITPSSTTLLPGASFTVNWALANNGSVAANSTSTTVVRINQSTTSAAPIVNLAGVSTAALAASASVSQSATLTAPTAPGTYYIWVIADNFSEVTNQADAVNDLQHSAAITVLGSTPCVPIANVNDLQNINQNLSGNYCLMNDIDASATATWNGGAGFVPIGDASSPFSGLFDGKNHVINGLAINNGNADYIGLFGNSGGTILNVGLSNVSIAGGNNTGGLAGNNSGFVQNSYTTGNVAGSSQVGGLVGLNAVFGGSIKNSHSNASVTGGDEVGGLVGESSQLGINSPVTIANSYATGSVSGENEVGGLVGNNINGWIDRSYATGSVTGINVYIGGLVGFNDSNNGVVAQVSNSYATGVVVGGGGVGGLVGLNNFAYIFTSYAMGAVSGNNVSGNAIGGLVGEYSGGQIGNSYARGAVTGPTAVGGLVGDATNGSSINSSYSTGLVTGGTNVGGLVGSMNDHFVGLNSTYWDIVSSGQTIGVGLSVPNGNPAGVTGRTTAQLKSGLPDGFDSTVWATSSNVNSGYPYLQWQGEGPPPITIPTIISVSPGSGSSSGGTIVTITGTNFTGTTAVTFGGIVATNLNIASATSITVTTPAHVAGAVDVVVTAPGGTAIGAYIYGAPTVTNVSPNSGSSAGGTSVTITGTNLTGATVVTFDRFAATNLNVISATSVTATTPAHAGGLVDVAVTTQVGTGIGRSAFTYVAPLPPTITNVAPNSGSSGGGTGVTITGTNLSGASLVTFGGTPATILNVVSATFIIATTPAHTVGTVDVAVTAPGGNATSTGAYTIRRHRRLHLVRICTRSCPAWATMPMLAHWPHRADICKPHSRPPFQAARSPSSIPPVTTEAPLSPSPKPSAS